jgi:hypothetical protein
MVPLEPNVKRELALPGIGKRWFYKVAQYFEPIEHTYDIYPKKELLTALAAKNVDLFSFIDRSFLRKSNDNLDFYHCPETIGLLHTESYDAWLKSLPARERTAVRKTARIGLTTHVVDVDEGFIEAAHKIYNETPVRQGRKYSGFGITIDDVRKKFANLQTSKVIGAYLDNKLIGLIWVEFGDRVAAMMSFLSLISYRNKNPNNALIAAAVKLCDEKGYRYLTYGNMGYNPGLDFFKKNNGFRRVAVSRYFVPLTFKGQLAIKMNLCRSVERSFSPTITMALVPFYNIVDKFKPESNGPTSATDA